MRGKLLWYSVLSENLGQKCEIGKYLYHFLYFQELFELNVFTSQFNLNLDNQ